MTLPSTRQPAGARHPITILSERIAVYLHRDGLGMAEGLEVETEQFNFDALNFPPDHPARSESRTPSRREGSRQLLRDPHFAGAGAHTAGTRSPGLYRVDRTNIFVLTNWIRPTPGVPSSRGLAVDRGLTMGSICAGLSTRSPDLNSVPTRALGCARTSSRSPSRPRKSTSGFRTRRGGPGWVEWGGCGNGPIRMCCGPRVSILKSIRDSRSAWAGANAPVPQRHPGYAGHGRG